MAYAGFCKTFGPRKMLALGVAFAAAAGCAVSSVLNGVDPKHLIEGTLFGCMGGLWGFATASIAHDYANRHCAKNNYDARQGGAYVKKVQTASYVLTLASTLTFYQALYAGEVEDTHQEAEGEVTMQVEQNRPQLNSLDSHPRLKIAV